MDGCINIDSSELSTHERLVQLIALEANDLQIVDGVTRIRKEEILVFLMELQRITSGRLKNV